MTPADQIRQLSSRGGERAEPVEIWKARKFIHEHSDDEVIRIRVELIESVCRFGLRCRATERWLGLRVSWRTQAFRVSRRRQRDVMDRIRGAQYRALLQISDCVWAVHECRGFSRERP